MTHHRRWDDTPSIPALIYKTMKDLRIDVKALRNEVADLTTKVVKIMTAQDDAAVVLEGVKDQLDKAKAEIMTRIAELEAAVAEGPVSARLQSAVDALRPAAQGLDDIVPDAPTP